MFNESLNQFRCWSVKWPDFEEKKRLDDDIIFEPGCEVIESYSDRDCCGWFLGITGGICIKWCGNCYLRTRVFKQHKVKSGELALYMGNFYDNTVQSGFNYETKDMLVFRDEIFTPVPQSLCNAGIFLANIQGGIDGPNVPEDGEITLHDMSGSLLANYNVNTGLFSNTLNYNYGLVSSFSFDNQNLNLRSAYNSENIEDFALKYESVFHKQPMESKNVLDNKMNNNNSKISLSINPVPADDKINLTYKLKMI